MIVTEFHKTREDGINLYRTYSDEGKLILQNETCILYEEAIDVENSGYTYTESDVPIGGDTDHTEATEVDYQNALRDMGVQV